MAAMMIDVRRFGLTPDLTKGRARKVVDAGLSWQGWNSANPTHPKGPDGRWVSGHPGVADLGRMHEHLGSLSSEDLAATGAHVERLMAALTAEKGKRRVAADRARKAEQIAQTSPAKPLTATGRGRSKGLTPEVREEVAAMVDRPMPADRQRLTEVLSGLTVAQMKELAAAHGRDLAAGNKPQKVTQLVETLIGYQLNSEAIRLGAWNELRDGPGARINEIGRQMTQTTDRAEYGRLHAERAALSSGASVKPTGPNREDHDAITSWRTDADRPEALRNPARPLTADTKATAIVRQLNAETSVPRANAILEPLTAAELTEVAVALEIRGYKGSTKAQLKEKIVYRTVAGPGQLRYAMGETADSMSADQINALTRRIRQIDEAMDEADGPARTKLDATRKELVAQRSALGAAAMGKPVNPAKPLMNKPKSPFELAQGLPEAGRGRAAAAPKGDLAQQLKDLPVEKESLERARAMLSGLKVPELKALIRELGPTVSQKGGRKAELVENIVAGTVDFRLRSQARLGGADPWGSGGSGGVDTSTFGASEGMDVDPDKWDAPAAPGYLDTPPKITNLGHFGPGDYHGDGIMGSVVQGMTPRQRSLEVEGERLDDVLGHAIIKGHSGKIGSSRQQLERFKEIAAQVGDPEVRARIEEAIAKLDKPLTFDVPSALKRSTPEPVRRLMHDLAGVPLVRSDDRELKALDAVISDFEAGKIGGGRFIDAVIRAADQRHESQEGWFELRAIRLRAMGELRSLQRTHRAALYPPKRSTAGGEAEIRSARTAMQDAYEELAAQYGDDPDAWPDARQDRQVQEYFELKQRVARPERGGQ